MEDKIYEKKFSNVQFVVLLITQIILVTAYITTLRNGLDSLKDSITEVKNNQVSSSQQTELIKADIAELKTRIAVCEMKIQALEDHENKNK
jgi:Tfp pilus assembly protein PilO